MRISRAFVLALALAFPIGAGCSGSSPESNSGGGGAVGTSTGDDPSFPPDNTTSVVAVATGSVPPFPSGAWVKHYGDLEDQRASALAVSDAGEIALVGTARGTIDFGNIPWMGTATDTDVVVARISSEGQAQWSRRYGDSCDQRGGAVANTASGNVLIAGDFCGKMSFGNTAVATTGAEIDLFVAMIDTLGEDVYSRSFGGKGAQIARAAAVDAQGNAVIVGSFDQGFDDGTGEVKTAGLDDALVIKLDPEGKVLWSRRFGGAESDLARSVAVDAAGNIVLGGSFGGSVDFGGGPLVATAGHPSAFLVRLDPDGKHLWSQTFATDDAVLQGVAIGADGRIAATGTFAGSIDFGAGPIAGAGEDDVFLVEVDSAGEPLWGHAFGGAKSESGIGLAFGVGNTLALTGTADETVAFGDFAISAGPNPYLSYVAEFDAIGNFTTGWAVGSQAPMQSVGVGLSDKLEVTFAGSFQGPSFDGFNTVTEPAGGWDMILIHRP